MPCGVWNGDVGPSVSPRAWRGRWLIWFCAVELESRRTQPSAPWSASSSLQWSASCSAPSALCDEKTPAERARVKRETGRFRICKGGERVCIEYLHRVACSTASRRPPGRWAPKCGSPSASDPHRLHQRTETETDARLLLTDKIISRQIALLSALQTHLICKVDLLLAVDLLSDTAILRKLLHSLHHRLHTHVQDNHTRDSVITCTRCSTLHIQSTSCYSFTYQCSKSADTGDSFHWL